MKKYLPVCILLNATIILHAQNYKPTWESLDRHPVPQWFKDAKFGIFIHWGVYSVPAYCTKGNYAEWYQYGLQTGDSSRIKYQQQKFGSKTYYQLADDFKAELFNPDEWARIFEQSGAKYIVLTSKHHDGFALWPNATASKTWGFKWNAGEAGPKRDLLGDLFKAVRKTSVHPGMYYSLYEWFNPLWKQDQQKFAMDHTWPQMKELINNYQPDVFWTDGDWDAGEDTWKSKEFLAWLYNESPVKDKVVTYDRWGAGVRFQHGMVYTPEYQPNLDFDNHYWEESRGMGFSYGYNREEDAWDYNSTQSLVLQLVDKVSRGGNFLLDIGPDEHGKIPPIMQERLLQMGEWLKINGEAIYNTAKWKNPCQWSEGNRNYVPVGGSGDLLLKLTTDPDPGFAVKEIFYSYNKNTNTLYAIFPKYPSGKKLLLKDIHLTRDNSIVFLSTKEKLHWQQEADNVVIQLPDYDPNQIKLPYAFVVKIENYGSFAEKPVIKISFNKDEMVPGVLIQSAPGTTVHYTTDGTEPTLQSTKYENVFNVDKTCVVKAVAFSDGILPSPVHIEKVVRYDWMKAVSNAKFSPGLTYKYFEPEGKISLGSMPDSKIISSGLVKIVSLQPKQRVDKFAFEFTGFIKAGADGMYDFYTESDDGSKLFIDDLEIVDNDGDHGTTEKAGRALLKKGYHRIRLIYFDSGGGNALKLLIKEPGKGKREVAAGELFH